MQASSTTLKAYGAKPGLGARQSHATPQYGLSGVSVISETTSA